MKHANLLLAAAITCTAIAAHAQKTILSGHFKYKPAPNVVVQYYADPVAHIEQDHTRVEATVDAGNNFTLELNIDKPVEINFMNGEKWVFINKYINPGDSLHFDFDSSAINIDGRGENGISAMFEYDNRFLDEKGLNEMQGSFRTMKDVEFAKYWSDWVDSGLAFYNNYFTAHKAPIGYIRAVEKDLKYNAAVNLAQFGWRGKNGNDSIFRNAAYRRCLDRFLVSDTNALTSGYYIFFLDVLTKYMPEPQPFNAPRRDVDYYGMLRLRDSVARRYFNGRVYDAALYAILWGAYKNVVRNEGTEGFTSAYAKAEQLMGELGKGFNDQSLFIRLHDKLAATKSAGIRAADFTATTLDGKTVRLSDLAGKVVYVDFWATSCAPCRAEIPQVKRLHEKYKGKDIEFLCVSFDRSAELLKRFIRETGFPGRHVMMPQGFASDAAKSYSISSIPRYLLIDRKGNIISADAPRPSGHPDEMIDNALKDK